MCQNPLKTGSFMPVKSDFHGMKVRLWTKETQTALKPQNTACPSVSTSVEKSLPVNFASRHDALDFV